jgi:hypothetical protein
LSQLDPDFGEGRRQALIDQRAALDAARQTAESEEAVFKDENAIGPTETEEERLGPLAHLLG